LDTPVLFLIFNRPDTSQKVFNCIRKAKPKKLFVSADGARSSKPGEDVKCAETRNIINNIDWDCEVYTNFSGVNLGCKKGVSSGINWFFNNVSEGIILEDDCIPDESFFRFAESMLEKYRNNERIMHIGGTNFQDGIKRNEYSYYFSRLCHVWGWATWKRAWDKYNVNIPDFTDGRFSEISNQINHDKYFQSHFYNLFLTAKENRIDTWDFQWVWTVWNNNGISIIPQSNLVENIGFGAEATHTKDSKSELSSMKTNPMMDILHPDIIETDLKADLYTFRTKIRVSKFKKVIGLIKNKFGR
jgi:hypothetical protein